MKPTQDKNSTKQVSKKPAAAPQTPKSNDGVEGEGSYTATRNYDKGVEQSVKAGKSDELAQQAKQALEGAEGRELEDAEREGKRGEPDVTARSKPD